MKHFFLHQCCDDLNLFSLVFSRANTFSPSQIIADKFAVWYFWDWFVQVYAVQLQTEVTWTLAAVACLLDRVLCSPVILLEVLLMWVFTDVKLILNFC